MTQRKANMKNKGQYFVAVRQDGKNEIYAFKTKAERAGFVGDLKRLGVQYATAEAGEDAESAKLKAASKATGYSVKQLRAMRRDAAKDAAFDRAEYCAMSQCEREAHDNR